MSMHLRHPVGSMNRISSKVNFRAQFWFHVLILAQV